MQIVKKLFIGFLIVVELINLAIGGLLIFVGVKMYQQFSQVTDPTVQGLQYTGIGTRACHRRRGRGFERRLSHAGSASVRPPGDTGLIVFGSLVVITAIVGLARVFVLTRYILLEVRCASCIRRSPFPWACPPWLTPPRFHARAPRPRRHRSIWSRPSSSCSLSPERWSG